MLLIEKVLKYIDARELPDTEQFVEMFASDGARFIDQEDQNWDFKDRWPFSYSDEYFFAIARIISSFANTTGGFLIFGVHDVNRTGGHNKVIVNTDKLRQAIVANMGACPEFEVRRYELAKLGNVDCLLILPRKMGELPFRFRKPTKYGFSIWVRDGHSVSPADTKHLPILYCRTDSADNQPIPGSLPPNPRTVTKFVGRLEFDGIPVRLALQFGRAINLFMGAWRVR